MEKRFRYCLMTFKRAAMGTPNIDYEYVHFRMSEEQDAYDYAERYSKAHEGLVVRLRLRRWRRELNKAEWSTLISFYNGRLFGNSLIFKAGARG